MRTLLAIIAATSFLACANAQEFNTSRIFAHNDYARAQPFYTAYALAVGYIEADVFLIDGKLLVAHERRDTDPGKTLKRLYLDPLLQEVRGNQGSAYADPAKSLTLMVDLKTAGIPTLDRLVDILNEYPDLLSCKRLHFMISGNVPDPKLWKDYSAFITIDGRPGVAYTPDQLARVAMISTSFRSHATWNGRGSIPENDLKKIAALRDDAHQKGKVFRFWATPDTEHAWKEQMHLQFDVIVTDQVEALAAFFKAEK